MASVHKRDGFTIVEILFVVGVMSALIVIGGTIAGKFASRHSTDSITRTISSSLQLMKIKSSRQGLDYLANLTFDSSKNTITIVTQRGNTNRGKSSCTSCYTTESSQTIQVNDAAVTINPATQTFDFNPNGLVVDSNGNTIASPIVLMIQPSDGKNGKRCGIVTVSPLGRISIVEGTWNSSSSICSAVY